MELSAQHITDLTKMQEKNINKSSIETNNSVIDNFIIVLFSIITLFLESVMIIVSFFKKGIFKKEILSKKTDLGFDLIIKRK